ncbi:hypothetical protein ACIG56_24450 [Nocardia fusca]|uniref:hypothetical protein n=1 Tax=Nocardia fusca TaxID=941183 RepID=UPI0037CA9B40
MVRDTPSSRAIEDTDEGLAAARFALLAMLPPAGEAAPDEESNVRLRPDQVRMLATE